MSTGVTCGALALVLGGAACAPDGAAPQAPPSTVSTTTVVSGPTTTPPTGSATMPPATITTSGTPSTSTTAATTTTTTSSTTTTTTTTTSSTVPGPTLPPRAAVWESAVDPERVNIVVNHPIGSADGIGSGIDMFAVTPADAGTPIGRACIETARAAGVGARECLVVQFRFDVAADFPVDADAPRAELTRIRAIAPDGREVVAEYGRWALPGTTGASHTILLPGVGESAIVYWSTGSELVGYTEFSGTVPGMILPVDWLGQPPGSTPPTSAPPVSATTTPPEA